MKWLLLFFLILPLGLSAQNVGININTPIFQLDVRSPTSNAVTFLNVASQDNTYFTRLIAGHQGAPASSLSWKTGVPLNLGMWDQTNFVYSLVMHLSPLNRVGINTFDPGFDLDVRGLENTFDGGELQLATPDQTNFLRFFGGRLGDPHPFVAFADTDTFHIVTTAADWSTYTRRMTLLPTGRVGIGTENPLANLDIVAAGDGAEILRLTTDRPWVFRQTGTGVNTKLTLQSTVNSKRFEILSSDSTNRAAVFHSNDVHSNVLLVPDGGEAGVGVEDPLAKFHVMHNSSIGWPSLRVTEDDSDFARIKLETGTEPGTYWDIAGKSDSVSANASLNFFYGSPGGSGDRMSIKGNGNVGIGTTSPAEKLHVQGTFRVSDLAGTGDRNVIVDSNGKFKIGTLGSGDSDWTETASAVYNNTHDIGIGTSNPGSKLHIIGPESNGTTGALKLTYPGTAPFFIDAHSMVLDGNEIDVTGTLSSSLDLQGNSAGGVRMVQ
ncbi:MAG: hypothetical protein R3330_05030, partial [Saprospiraceae bacterium]|nr:hypothetical protein [Saprospiraceae bacterium]